MKKFLIGHFSNISCGGFFAGLGGRAETVHQRHMRYGRKSGGRKGNHG